MELTQAIGLLTSETSLYWKGYLQFRSYGGKDIRNCLLTIEYVSEQMVEVYVDWRAGATSRTTTREAVETWVKKQNPYYRPTSGWKMFKGEERDHL